MVEASMRRVFANAHTYHINSISVNSDQETYLSADDLRINLWNLEITDQSFSKSFITLTRNLFLMFFLPVFYVVSVSFIGNSYSLSVYPGLVHARFALLTYWVTVYIIKLLED